MAKLSRIAKYEELRNKLQNDAESDIKSNELNEFATRLNKFDSNTVKDIKFENNKIHDPIHNRREEYLNTSSIKIPSSNHSSTFDNEYLDEYINEVKQYNKNQGLLVSDDTQKNILNELYGERPIPKKPYKETETSEIPFKNSSAAFANPYSALSDDDLEKTRSNIAAEVKSLISGNTAEFDLDKDIDMNLAKQLEIQKTESQKIIEETDKMKLQLDEYGDTLSDFDDKVENANRILNFVLIIMIFALVIVIGLLIYWNLLNRGII